MTISPISPSQGPLFSDSDPVDNILTTLSTLQSTPSCPKQIPVFYSILASTRPSPPSKTEDTNFANAIQICVTMLQNDANTPLPSGAPNLLWGLTTSQMESLNQVLNTTNFPNGTLSPSDYNPIMTYASTLMTALSQTKGIISVPQNDVDFLSIMQGASGSTPAALADSLENQPLPPDTWTNLPQTPPYSTQHDFSMFVFACTEGQYHYPINN